MASALATTHQTIAVDQITSIVVTEIVQVSDQFVREVRVFGEPDGTAGAPVFVLRLSADTADKVKLSTPELEF